MGGCGHTVGNYSRTGLQLPCDMTNLITSWLGFPYHPTSPHTPGANEGCFRKVLMACGWCEEWPKVMVLSPAHPTPQNESLMEVVRWAWVSILLKSSFRSFN